MRLRGHRASLSEDEDSGTVRPVIWETTVPSDCSRCLRPLGALHLFTSNVSTPRQFGEVCYGRPNGSSQCTGKPWSSASAGYLDPVNLASANESSKCLHHPFLHITHINPERIFRSLLHVTPQHGLDSRIADPVPRDCAERHIPYISGRGCIINNAAPIIDMGNPFSSNTAKRKSKIRIHCRRITRLHQLEVRKQPPAGHFHR